MKKLIIILFVLLMLTGCSSPSGNAYQAMEQGVPCTLIYSGAR